MSKNSYLKTNTLKYIREIKYHNPNSNINIAFDLIRHGKTNWSPSSLKDGPKDLHLSDTGISQATKSANYLKDNNLEYDYIFTSP